MRFAVYEELRTYKVLYDWLRYNQNNATKTVDITLMLVSSHNNVIKNITFKNAFLTQLGGFEIDSQSSDTEYCYIDATFRYDSFDF